ncbi:NAD(P)-dependent dehydrogenase (short-subunit alcohol dehydrogenase family) [Paenibacillus endophyticus]|uniref:NAD(P)-dependent dehydrogenase (Short-subunit alcohol dehydrogenase family) n=1 Tax=Paenibacillus endophyticus TaxID=1294268 RepID=A0A7W5C9A8_9BACL|nr:glucose 1-dehydrogenase [Paenibacillus endophyticus]MBB3153485.1 NAD(P)-dependent dehydrogenase (short-subunit alcohol dehydrogenase family) [Paenibacillus endophyticus]
MRFKEKVVLVTGGGSGIGEVSAQLFAAEGAHVIVADRNGAEGQRSADELCKRYPALKGLPRAVAMETDVSRETDVEVLLAQTVQLYGKLDVLFNNAAVICSRPLEEIDERMFDQLYAVNVKGVYLMIKHAIPHLRRSKGSVVNMSSLNGLVGQRQNPIYAASKGAVIALTKSLALDYAQDGVRVNCVCPAGVMTPLLDEWTRQQPNPAEAVQSLNAMHPLGRPATSEEVAQAVLFLASEQAAFITGVALPVEGGASLGY